MSWGQVGAQAGSRLMPMIINNLMGADGKTTKPHPDVVGAGLDGAMTGGAVAGPVGAAVGGALGALGGAKDKPFLPQGGVGETIAGLAGGVGGALLGGLADPEQERQRANMQIQMPQRQRPGLMQTRITGEV